MKSFNGKVIMSLAAFFFIFYNSYSRNDGAQATEAENLGEINNSNKSIELSDENTKNLSSEEVLRKIEIENALYRAKLEQKLAQEFSELRLKIERLKLEKERLALEHEIENERARKVYIDEVNALRDQREKLSIEVDIMQTKMAKDAEKFNAEILVSQKIMQKLRLEMDIMKGTLEQRGIKEELGNYVDLDPTDFYTDNPIQSDGSLVISNRRIDLNGVITPWKANYVVDTIQYFNNQNSRYPIFIVIEFSPGGSVLAGSRILEAMHQSKAPVYVVLKGFVASMSAVITTLAKKSYAYPNAQILHHQPSYSNMGNLNVRESKELAKQLQECHKRFLGPVAKKMKISLDELDKRFYEKAVHGDWEEYADDAKKINWVDEVISSIKDINISKKPDPKDYTWKNYLEEYWRTGIVDEANPSDNRNEILLPKLNGNDFYYMHDPERRYNILA